MLEDATGGGFGVLAGAEAPLLPPPPHAASKDVVASATQSVIVVLFIFTVLFIFNSQH